MEQLITPRLYVNPMIDVAFKYLFGTEKNKHLLKGLLEHVFSVDIEDICYDNTEQIGESVDARNASRVISRQAPKGPWDYGFKPVYFLGLIDFPMPETVGHGSGFVHRYSLRNDQTNEPMTDSLKFVFMEVGPFNKPYKECSSFEEKFLFYMKNLPTFAERPDTHQDQYFEELLQTAEYLAMDMETQAMYEKRLKEMRDIQNVENYFRRVTLAEGRAKGLAEGRAEGKAEGKAEEQARMAKTMKDLGYPTEEICKVTGLAPETVQQS